MKIRNVAFAAMALAAAVLLSPGGAVAGGDPLFSNVTTAEPHRARMAIGFTRNQQQLKHPVTVFLNDKGVLLGSKAKAAEFGEHHAALAAIMKDGGNVIICVMCMEHYGVKKEELLEGIQLGSPELTGKLLFGDDDTKTLSW